MKTVKGIMVTVDNFSGFDTKFRPECVRFENDKLHSLIIRNPTEFYRYIGGKRFLVYADIENLKKSLRDSFNPCYHGKRYTHKR